jgi:hypothetical protein
MAHPDLDELLNALLPFAQQLLSKHGEFYPFRSAMTTDGEIEAAAYPDFSGFWLHTGIFLARFSSRKATYKSEASMRLDRIGEIALMNNVRSQLRSIRRRINRHLANNSNSRHPIMLRGTGTIYSPLS